MKTLRNTALLTLALGIGAAAFATGGETRRAATSEVQVNITGSYVPPNFGTDEPFVVVNGLFPNSCYSWSRGGVKHVDNKTHEVSIYANVKMGMCLMVLVPFSDEVSLGQLEKGDHILRFMGTDGTYTEKALKIE